MHRWVRVSVRDEREVDSEELLAESASALSVQPVFFYIHQERRTVRLNENGDTVADLDEAWQGELVTLDEHCEGCLRGCCAGGENCVRFRHDPLGIFASVRVSDTLAGPIGIGSRKNV